MAQPDANVLQVRLGADGETMNEHSLGVRRGAPGDDLSRSTFDRSPKERP